MRFFIVLLCGVLCVFFLTACAADHPSYHTIQTLNPTAGDATTSTRTIDVYKSLQSKQCAQHSGISLGELEQQLSAHHIPVLAKRQGNDSEMGIMHITVCGASDGAIGVFTIPHHDADKADKAGFRKLQSAPTT